MTTSARARALTVSLAHAAVLAACGDSTPPVNPGGGPGTEHPLAPISWTRQLDTATTPWRMVAPVGASEAFAVGPGGIHRFANGAWTVSRADWGLGAIWGSSASDVWAVGEKVDATNPSNPTRTPVFLRFDGTTWTSRPPASIPSLTPTDVSGSGPSDVYVSARSTLADAGFVLRYDGSAWSTEALPGGTSQPPPALAAIWASAPGDVFAVGSQGTILRRSGGTWSKATSGTTASLRDVTGRSAADVYAVGANGVILHFDGASWTPVASGTTDDLVSARIGADGALYVVATTCDRFLAATGNYPPCASTIRRLQGGSWTVELPARPLRLNDVWARAPGSLVAFGDRMLTQSGGTWSDPAPYAPGLAAVWAESQSEVFAVGDRGTILQYDGSAWSARPSGTSWPLRAVWGSGATDVYAAGQAATLLRYDGSTWSRVPLPGVNGTGSGGDLNIDFQAVAGNGPDDVIVGGVFLNGRAPVIYHRKGASWREETLPALTNVYGLWAAGPSDAFAVGSRLTAGAVLKYDGVRWTAIAGDTLPELRAVWGFAADDVYVAAANSPTMYHWDGEKWRIVAGSEASAAGGAAPPARLWGTSDHDMLLARPGFPLLQWNGGRWTPLPAAMAALQGDSAVAIWGAGASDLWVAGRRGALIRGTR